MKRIPRFFKSLFSPMYMQDIDISEIISALNDTRIRNVWLHDLYEELKRLNLDVDQALLKGETHVTALSARRKAFGDVLEMILIAKRRKVEEKDPYPKILSEVDLDRTTV